VPTVRDPDSSMSREFLLPGSGTWYCTRARVAHGRVRMVVGWIAPSAA
jgi:hypothetical protein